MTRAWYVWHAYELGSKLGALLVLLFVAGLVAYARFQISVPRLEADYALWRIEKPNSSETDRFRAERRLIRLLQHDDKDVAAYAYRRLAERLRAPGPALARIDSLLQIALGARCTAGGQGIELPALFIEALVTANADARARMHRTLVFLGEEQNPVPAAELRDWSPSEGDSVTDLQRRIAQWRSYWRTVSAPRWADCPKRP